MSVSRQCVILIGGLGSRLGDLVKDCPKPLLEVASKPFINHLIRHVARFGFNDIVLLAGYRADVVQSMVQDGRIGNLPGVNIRVIIESSPMGTGGALQNATEILADEFLMMNGDTLFDFNLLDLAENRDNVPWLARLAIRMIPQANRFGIVTLEGEHITGFLERSKNSGPGAVNGGIYYLRRDILDRISDIPCSLERDIFPALAQENKLLGRMYEGYFIDIGIPEDLERARSEFVSHTRPAVFFDRDGVLNHDAGYTYKIDEFEWMDGARTAIKSVNDAGWYVFVVTNQAGVARGYYDESAVKRLHDWMNETLREEGAHIDDFSYCPHHPDGSIEEYSVNCRCRKPQPGMLYDIMSKWRIDRDKSVLIGDKDTDLAAAESAGIRPVLFSGGNVNDYLPEL